MFSMPRELRYARRKSLSFPEEDGIIQNMRGKEKRKGLPPAFFTDNKPFRLRNHFSDISVEPF